MTIGITEKLRGGYYTPGDVAEWLTSWAIRRADEHVLEPAAGDGVFVRHAVRRLASLGAKKRAISAQVQAVELIRGEADKVREVLREEIGGGTVTAGDFFAWDLEAERDFDVVLGNPPFIRYQNFPEPSRGLAMDMMRAEGLKPNKLTNIWVPFVVAAVRRLRRGGRLGMIVPAELLQVSYAAQLRMYLVDHFERIDIVACNQMLFAGAEQEVVLLLADRKNESAAACAIDLTAMDSIEDITGWHPPKRPVEAKLVHHSSEKWLKYLLSASEIELMREMRTHPRVGSLGAHAEIDVGVVTGNNDFFVLAREDVQRLRLYDFVIPLVGKAAHIRGAEFRQSDYDALAAAGQRVFLLNANVAAAKKSAALRAYLARGEELGVHTGYKCSIRKAWYEVPTLWRPDAFVFRQIHEFPRIVKNETAATSTDTIHRLRCEPGLVDGIAASFYTHLSAASAEIEGRSYGGGVLELEPTEAERVCAPKTLAGALPLAEADRLLRAGKLDALLAENDRLVLRQNIGLTKRECAALRGVWLKMRERRAGRRKRK